MLTIICILATACVALLAAGCAGDNADAVGDPLGGEKLAFLENDGSVSRIKLSGLGRAESQAFIQWPESSHSYEARPDGKYFSMQWPDSDGPTSDMTRFSFSRDGRYLAVSPRAAGGGSRPLVVATDGSQVRRLPWGSFWPRLSPDGKLVSYNRSGSSADWPNITAVLEVAGGGETILAEGLEPRAAFWLDERTLIYTDLQEGDKKQNSVFIQDVYSRERRALTPAGRDFSFYAPIADYPLRKLALMEFEFHYNVWSLDLDTGLLAQVTNNSRLKQNAMYLPDMETVMFQDSPQGLEPRMFSDIFLVSDRGRGMSMLVGEYFYSNSLFTASGTSGRIAYQHIEEGHTAIWVSENGRRTPIDTSKSAWLGDPSFAPVLQWRQPNPLRLIVDDRGTAPDSIISIRIANDADAAVEGTLRLFPGPDLALATEGEPDATGTFGAVLQMQVDLAGRDSTQSMHPVWLRNEGQNQDATLLVTLAVPGSPPVISWLDLSP